VRAAPLLALLVAGACEDASYRDIGAEITVLVQRNDPLVPPARRRLVAYGRRAVPHVEVALHTAPTAGKLNLLAALDEIADPEAAAILRHLAVYDPDPPVRAACEEILGRWSRRPALAAAAGRALEAIAAKRARGEGPIVRDELRDEARRAPPAR
jgi:HEAT repeat protein